MLFVGVQMGGADSLSDYGRDQEEAIALAVSDPSVRASRVFLDSSLRKVGFGFQVGNISEGNKILESVRARLRGLGITLHVGIWGLGPKDRAARPAGVDAMLSLDL